MKNKNISQRCGTCKFWDLHGDGSCRANILYPDAVREHYNNPIKINVLVGDVIVTTTSVTSRRRMMAAEGMFCKTYSVLTKL